MFKRQDINFIWKNSKYLWIPKILLSFTAYSRESGQIQVNSIQNDQIFVLVQTQMSNENSSLMLDHIFSLLIHPAFQIKDMVKEPGLYC